MPQPLHPRRVVAGGANLGRGPPEHASCRGDLFETVAGLAGDPHAQHADGALAIGSASGEAEQGRAAALEHPHLLLVMVGMTTGAVGGGVDDLLLVFGVLNRQVAIEAVEGVLGDVLLVNEIVLLDPLQVILPVVANHAPLAGHLAVAADQVAMTVGAIDSFLVGQLVGELDAAAQVVRLLRDLVAAGAGAQLLVERLVLEVAEEAGRRGDRDVLSLHDLAVAARAAEPLAPPALAQVRRVVEGNPMEV